MFDYMCDCIHLKACRRVQKIGKAQGHSFGRHCTEECTAYMGKDEVAKEIQNAINWAFEQGKADMDYIQVKDIDGIMEWLKGGKDD